MMIYPSINKLMEKVDSKYTLVIATAKRAREIYQTGITFTECDSDKPVTVAINEIYENKVSFKNPDQNKISVDDRIMNMILEEDRNLVAQDTDDESQAEEQPLDEE